MFFLGQKRLRLGDFNPTEPIGASASEDIISETRGKSALLVIDGGESGIFSLYFRIPNWRPEVASPLFHTRFPECAHDRAEISPILTQKSAF